MTQNLESQKVRGEVSGSETGIEKENVNLKGGGVIGFQDDYRMKWKIYIDGVP